jgi:alkylation response protein AidB-like acyl-CoA dehydrogenase
MGMTYLMQRLARVCMSTAVSTLTSCEDALRWTLDYAYEGTAFGSGSATSRPPSSLSPRWRL